MSTTSVRKRLCESSISLYPAVEQVGDLRCGVETERSKLVHLIRATPIGNDPISGRGEVCGHRRPHVAEADKADFALRG